MANAMRPLTCKIKIKVHTQKIPLRFNYTVAPLATHINRQHFLQTSVLHTTTNTLRWHRRESVHTRMHVTECSVCVELCPVCECCMWQLNVCWPSSVPSMCCFACAFFCPDRMTVWVLFVFVRLCAHSHEAVHVANNSHRLLMLRQTLPHVYNTKCKCFFLCVLECYLNRRHMAFVAIWWGWEKSNTKLSEEHRKFFWRKNRYCVRKVFD